MTESITLQTVLALALRENPAEAGSLLAYASADHQADGASVLASLQSAGEMDQYLRALRAREGFSGLAEIHPDWLLEVLQEESPRVIGVVLRYLPSKQVRVLLERLPPRVRLKLPKMIEAFYVPGEILEMIRSRLERRFVPIRVSHQSQLFRFEHLVYLKVEEMDVLFRDLGLSELALAFVGSSRKVLQTILNRFNIGDAKEILRRLRPIQGEAKWFVQDAKYSILELNGKSLGVELFLIHLGLLSLAKGAVGTDPVFANAFRQKLALESAREFKQFLDEKQLARAPEREAKRQDWILNHVRRLCAEGKIEAPWAEFENEEIAA